MPQPACESSADAGSADSSSTHSTAGPTRGASMGLTITVALDRDAQHTLNLTLVPSGSQRAPTSWLLLHGIPATASLPLALRRLRAASDDTASSQAAAVASETADAAHVPVAASSGVTAVLVGYVTSEVHAYCLLIQCQSPHVADQVRRRLEKEAAPGSAAPVVAVEPEGCVNSHEVPTSPPPTVRSGGRTTTRDHVPLEQVLFSCCIAVRGGSFGDGAVAEGSPRHAGLSPVLPPKLALPPATPPHRGASVGTRERAVVGGDSPLARAETPTSRGPQSPLRLPFAHVVPPALQEDCSICLTDPLYTRPVVVTLCHHAFHVDCYSKLVEGSTDCPLCRFSLCDLQNDAQCGVCGTFEDLWICLVCGFTGCGRARWSHQQQHSQSMGHSCAMQANTGRIWDSHAGLFLHQEVAIQLGEEEDSKTAAADTAKRQSMLWVDDDDADLRAALTESKENAVGQFYVDVLQRLMAEQTEWLARGCPGGSSSTVPGAAAARALAEPTARATAVPVNTEVATLEAEEAKGRGAIACLYIGELHSLCARESIVLSTVTKRSTRQQRQVQEAIMLQCHQNTGLKQRNVRMAAQLEKLRASGKAEVATKRAELEKLEAEATRLLADFS